MSSSNSKVQTKTQPAKPQQNATKTTKPATKVSTEQSGKQPSFKADMTNSMKNSYDALESIQHEYEQFEVNMDEKD